MLLTLPTQLPTGTVEVFDALGSFVLRTQAAAEQPFVELDTRAWYPGIYLARLLVEGAQVAEAKFTIIR